MKWTPRLMKWGLRIYGPYLGAGIRVESVSRDWRHTRVSLGLTWFNRNFVGSHFGGSLYAMTDPHYMLMLIQILGPSYRVWDRSAAIDFIRPGKGRVYADFTITDQDVGQILAATQNGEKYLHTFEVAVLDQDQEIVARVKKVLYIRKKK